MLEDKIKNKKKKKSHEIKVFLDPIAYPIERKEGWFMPREKREYLEKL